MELLISYMVLLVDKYLDLANHDRYEEVEVWETKRKKSDQYVWVG